WSVRMFSSNQQTFWCGVLTDCGTVWRYGCRYRAPRDGFTACRASGEGAAPSTHLALIVDPSLGCKDQSIWSVRMAFNKATK
ncbi:hypothetical protein, partial [Xanthomonas hortorum]|uniref:hypothetical protein n=1 Tax=Xanthomonas hortorum TaxID=56454 RepID=UPI001E4C994F